MERQEKAQALIDALIEIAEDGEREASTGETPDENEYYRNKWERNAYYESLDDEQQKDAASND